MKVLPSSAKKDLSQSRHSLQVIISSFLPFFLTRRVVIEDLFIAFINQAAKYQYEKESQSEPDNQQNVN